MKREKKLKEASFNTFAKYFDNDKEKYFASLKKLSKEDLKRFLKLVRFYIVYFLRLQPTKSIDPARDFKLITFFSLIEAIMSKETWKPFENWLSEKVPIEIKNAKDLEQLKEAYYKMYGSGRKAKEFFNKYVEGNDKKLFLNKLKISNKISKLDKAGSLPLADLIKKVYDARSRFIHDARPPDIIIDAPIPVISKLGKDYIWSELDEELLQGILEKGMLKHLGLL